MTGEPLNNLAGRQDVVTAAPVQRLGQGAWAIDHPGEFGLMFASPVLSAVRQGEDSPRQRAGQWFERVFLDRFADLWERAPYPVPEFEDLPSSIRLQICEDQAAVRARSPRRSPASDAAGRSADIGSRRI